MIEGQSIHQFLDRLASKSPTPGGGSVAAIAGSMGAALVSMVANLTLGKKGYEGVQAEMEETLVRAESLRKSLSALVQADVDAFGQVMAAYALPKATDEEQAARMAAIQSALQAATDIPLACARACAEVVRLSRVAADHGNRNVVADAGAALVTAYAALRCCALNVHVNLGSIQNSEFATSRLTELDSILSGMDALNEETYRIVLAKL
jgi:formiminotetrahydrofolate cyclodeaminase